MPTSDQKAAIATVRILAELIRREIDCDALPSKSADRLLKDLRAIPDRFARQLAADARLVQRWKQRKKANA